MAIESDKNCKFYALQPFSPFRSDHNAIMMFMKFNQNLWKMEKSCKIYELCRLKAKNARA